MADPVKILFVFFSAAAKDSRIGISHIGLFATLVKMAVEDGDGKSLIAYGAQVMEAAKISSTATYHKLITDLATYGYILYQPSFYKGKASSISFP